MTTIKDIVRNNEYILESELGKGGFGCCYVATDINTKNKFACKKIKITSLATSEILIHSKLCHTNIVQLISSFKYKKRYFILMELCCNGNLEKLINTHGPLENPEVRCITQQIVYGLQFLHSRMIAHRDLTMRNILIDANFTVKIADFGLAAQLKDLNDFRNSFCGTPCYVAPEIVEMRMYNLSVDIWALGCVVYTLIEGNLPFSAKTDAETQIKIINILYQHSPRTCESAKMFLKTIFVYDTKHRPDAFHVLNHPYFEEEYTPSSLPASLLAGKAEKSKEDKIKTTVLQDRTNFYRDIAPKKTVLLKKENESKQEIKHNMILRPRKEIKNNGTNLMPHKNFKIYEDPSVNEESSVKNLLKCLKNISKKKEFNCEKCIKDMTNFLCVTRWTSFEVNNFGYHLSDGSMGILFSDGSSFIRKHGGEINYCPKNGNSILFSQDSVPSALIGIAQCAKTVHSRLLTLNRFGPISVSEHPVTVKHVRHYAKGEFELAATTVYLSNGTYQVNFSNHDKFIANIDENLLAIAHESLIETYSLSMLQKYGAPHAVKEKVANVIYFLQKL